MIDIANKCSIAKGTILYHFKSKDNLFYEIISESISAELDEITAHALSLSTIDAIKYLLNIFFIKRKSLDILCIIDNSELFEKCHEVMDEVRRKTVMPVFYSLISKAVDEGILEINDPDIASKILGYGFEGFIHNNYQKFTDKEYHKRFLKVAEEICNNLLKPIKVKFELEV